jgi:CDP-6-deoxy-D-xylo-4-hexulose-3-dehydrase
VFCDINLKNLSFDIDKLKQIITPNTKAIFLTHVLGINGLTDELLQICKDNNILLIEDVCESHGATFKGKKAGSIGFASNFSFYFAHHMSTIEGGMICTNDEYFYQICRALRSHGMVREMTDEKFKQQIINENPDLNKDFIFLHPAHNFRSTEINAVLGLSQIKKLDNNNSKRISNFKHFIENLDSSKYITNIETEGQCNYAFIIILKESSFEIRSGSKRYSRITGKFEFIAR